MAWLNKPSVLLLWPYGVMGAEAIPMCYSFLAPAIAKETSTVNIMDCSLGRLHPASAEFGEAVRRLQPDLIGISAWSQNWRWIQVTIDVLHKNLMGVPVILGGPHISATEDPVLGSFD